MKAATTKQKKARSSNPEAEAAAICNKLGYVTFELQPREWLDTGSRLLNSVLGSEEKGIAYGKMIEAYGPESHGKSLLALLLAGLAQGDGADAGWVDLENSLDKPWAERQGIDWDRLLHFYPKLIRADKKEKPRLETAEELCDEVELWMERRHTAGVKKLLVVVDSVAAMLVEEEALAGNTDQNMRTKVALASFLSRLTRRWCALAQVYSACIVFINQVRSTPGAWGNPENSPGGRALKHYCAIRVSLRRVKGGKVLQRGRMVGLKGIIRNMKNKAGGGSLEGMEAGFKAHFLRNDWRFLSAAKLRKDSEDGGGE